MTHTTTPELIRSARERANLTQKALGEALGYGKNAQNIVANWELGNRPVPLYKIRQLCDLLGIDPLSFIP
jgi:transcriptional regulator with XRE-family HTH domain